MKILRGRGKIYTSQGEYLDEVTYEIYLKSSNGTGTEWLGEITPDAGILPVGNHIIELEDGRRGTGITGINTYSSFELVVDSFSIEGTGPLKPQNG
jgi:hypothetical protein